MRRRDFIMALGGTAAVVAAVVGGLAARAQQADGRAAALLSRILQLQADSTAREIAQFLKELESQIGWTTQLPWSNDTVEQRYTNAQRLLHQMPAITTFRQLDSSGREQLEVSRLPNDLVGRSNDFSQSPEFTEAVAHKVYYRPVYFRLESEPYMC